MAKSLRVGWTRRLKYVRLHLKMQPFELIAPLKEELLISLVQFRKTGDQVVNQQIKLLRLHERVNEKEKDLEKDSENLQLMEGEIVDYGTGNDSQSRQDMDIDELLAEQPEEIAGQQKCEQKKLQEAHKALVDFAKNEFWKQTR